MRAVVYRGVNDLRVETVPVPRIRPHELLVQVAVCGVCPTDIKKILHGTVPPPRIFGHETAGTIVRAGARARGFKPGDRVALHHHVPCLDCHFCRHHAFAQCATYKRTGITAGFEPAGGGYAEYVRVMPFVLPGVVKIPARNSFVEGALLEPVNTVLKAVRRLSLLRGDVVLVAGQGPVGLMFTRLLQLAGAQVIATDLMASRLRLAKKFGARWTMLAQTGGRAELPLRPNFKAAEHRRPTPIDDSTIQHVTKGHGLDAAVIAVPSDDVVRQALGWLRGGGQLMLFAHTKRANSVGRVSPLRAATVNPSAGAHGLSRHSHATAEVTCPAALDPRPSTFSLDLASVCVDEKDLLGSYSSDFTLQREVARLVFSRRLDVRPLISHRFPLEQTAAAVQLASRPTEDSLKIIVAADINPR
jgi:L-iditol 2-dehydrogenase